MKNETVVKEVENDVQMDRRHFLKTTGKVAIGAALAASSLNVLTGCEAAYETTYPEKQELTYEYVSKSGEEAPPFPFPYQKLDPTTCAERAYAGYQQKGG